jgi:hypothetical protein
MMFVQGLEVDDSSSDQHRDALDVNCKWFITVLALVTR